MSSGLEFTQEEYDVMRKEKINSLIDNILTHLEKEWEDRKINSMLMAEFDSVPKLYEKFKLFNQISPILTFSLTNDKNHIQAIVSDDNMVKTRIGIVTIDKNFDHFAIVTHKFTDPYPGDKIEIGKGKTIQSTTYLRLSILLRRVVSNDNKTRNILEKILLDIS